jgi:hypothetical protein
MLIRSYYGDRPELPVLTEDVGNLHDLGIVFR